MTKFTDQSNMFGFKDRIVFYRHNEDPRYCNAYEFNLIISKLVSQSLSHIQEQTRILQMDNLAMKDKIEKYKEKSK